MAEFCLKCFNELNGTNYREQDVTLDDDLCEGCGQVMPCVVSLYPPRAPGWFAGLMQKLLCRR